MVAGGNEEGDTLVRHGEEDGGTMIQHATLVPDSSASSNGGTSGSMVVRATPDATATGAAAVESYLGTMVINEDDDEDDDTMKSTLSISRNLIASDPIF